jgi:hypothetical protein
MQFYNQKPPLLKSVKYSRHLSVTKQDAQCRCHLITIQSYHGESAAVLVPYLQIAESINYRNDPETWVYVFRGPL